MNKFKVTGKINIHYAWIILLLCFMALLSVQGIRLSFGAFMGPWEKEFSLDRGTISLISVVSFIFYGLSQPIIGKLIDKFGVRKIICFSLCLVGVSIFLTKFAASIWQLFVLYGIIGSIGFGGVSNIATTVLITKWFNEKRGLAFGVLEAGFGAGQMIIVPSSLILIDKYGWRDTISYLAVFVLVFILPLILLFLKDSPSNKGLLPLGAPIIEEKQQALNTGKKEPGFINNILKQRQFWFLSLSFFICGITTTGLMDTHFISFSHDSGFSTNTISAAVSILAAFNVIGILSSGVIADKWDSRKLLGIIYAIRALSLFMLIYIHDSSLLFVFSVMFGVSDFATVAPTQMLAAKYFKNYSVGFVLGLMFLGHQIGSALGSYLPGLLYSITGGYSIIMNISVVLCIIASLMCFGLPKGKDLYSEIVYNN